MNPKYAPEILKGVFNLGKIATAKSEDINTDSFKGDYNVGLYKIVPEEYQGALKAHPVIKVDPTDTTHSVIDKKMKISKK